MKDVPEMMGFKIPGDQKVPVPVRNWNGMKLALWRSRTGWDIAAKEATEILARCRHDPHCDGEMDESVVCSPTCPDREIRMSALVILNAAKMFAPVSAQRIAGDPYYAPSREFFSEVIAELAASQAELEALQAAGVRFPPPANEEAVLPKRTALRIREGEFGEEELQEPEETSTLAQEISQ